MSNSNKILRKMYYGLYKRNFRYLTSNIRMLPKFIIIGTVRSGSTSLYYNICEHPNIQSASYDEIGFFDTNYELGLNWYKSMFPTIFQKYFLKNKLCSTGEDTPFYFWSKNAANRIKNDLPEIKLITILRNPIDRAYSNYHLGVAGGTEKLSFEEVINIEIDNLEKNGINSNNLVDLCSQRRSYIIKSIYHEQMKIWTEKFSQKNLLVISTEDMSKQTSETLNEIFEFLEIKQYNIKQSRKEKSRDYPKMNSSTRDRLIEFFRDHNKQLYTLIQKKFQWDV